VAQGERQRVGRIGRPWRFRQLQQPGDHGGDLGLVRVAVSGSGTADKAQVTAMITRLLKLPESPKPADAADALALALCHLWRSPMQARLLAAATKARMAP
jgi:hypothetical protein